MFFHHSKDIFLFEKKFEKALPGNVLYPVVITPMNTDSVIELDYSNYASALKYDHSVADIIANCINQRLDDADSSWEVPRGIPREKFVEKMVIHSSANIKFTKQFIDCASLDWIIFILIL